MRLEEFEDDYAYPHAYLARGFYEDTANTDYFTNETNPFGLFDHEIAEVMCHPAFIDQRLLDMSSYALPRAKEMMTLRSPLLKEWVQQNDIELINFSDLKK